MLFTKPIISKVINFVKNKDIFDVGDNCLIAVSGGFDSTALIDIIFKIKNLFKINSIAIAHINYNLRGQDSRDDQVFVKSLAKKYDIKLHLLDLDLNQYIDSLQKKDSLENIARTIRYDFFKKTAIENNYNKVVLAHNSNDNAETVILKLIRGTVSGLKGIDYQRTLSTDDNIQIIRPLLCLSRIEIETYTEKSNLKPRLDKSNISNEYTRNRVRNNLLPLILLENPNFLESISQSTEVIRIEDKFLDKIANSIIDSCLISVKENEIVLSYKKLKKNDKEIIGRVIKNTFFRLKKDKKSFSYKHIEAIKKNIEKNIGKKLIELPDNYFFIKDREHLIFSKSN